MDFDAYRGQVILLSLVAWGKLSLAYDRLLKSTFCGNRPAIPENRLESLRKLSAKESGAGQCSSIQHTPLSDALQLQLSLTSFAVVSILVCLGFF